MKVNRAQSVRLYKLGLKCSLVCHRRAPLICTAVVGVLVVVDDSCVFPSVLAEHPRFVLLAAVVVVVVDNSVVLQSGPEDRGHLPVVFRAALVPVPL